MVRDSNVPADRVSQFAVVRIGGDETMLDIVEKPDAATLASFGDDVYLSMNCWRFDASVLDACRRVPLSARGERELTDAVRLARHDSGTRFRVVRMKAGVLDLSSRGDIAERRGPPLGGRGPAVMVPDDCRHRGIRDAPRGGGLQARAVCARSRSAWLRPPAQDAAFFVPGRIEVLGKHTDYGGGRSLLCAAEQGFCVVAVAQARSPGDGGECRHGRSRGPGAGSGSSAAARPLEQLPGYRAPARGAQLPGRGEPARTSPLRATCRRRRACRVRAPSWWRSSWPSRRSTNWTARQTYRAAVGRPTDLAGYLGTIENGRTFGPLAGDQGVGTFGGSEDHTAILCCRSATLSQYPIRACPLRA